MNNKYYYYNMKPTPGYIKALKHVTNPKSHCPLKSTTKIHTYPYANNTQLEKHMHSIKYGSLRMNMKYGSNYSSLPIFENKNKL